jgi:DNA-binding transcriptional ArsR family regulator
MENLRIVVQPGTGYELLVSAVAAVDRSAQGRIDAAIGLRKSARSVDGGGLLKKLERVGREPYLNLLGFVHAMTEQPTAANAVQAIANADPTELKLALCGYNRRAFRITTRPQVIREAVEGDPAAIREFKRTSYPDLTHWQVSLRYLLATDADDVRADLAGALARWLETGFGELEPDIAKAQVVNAEAVRGLVASRSLELILERIAPGITFTREVGQEVMVLAPSVVVRPGFALSDYGATLVLAYPATTRQEDDRTAPPERLVWLGKALGDELRLRALRELRDGPMSASELARRLDIPRTTIHHHLSLLINAGLARLSVDDARWGNVELRPEAVAELSELAESWLLGKADNGEGG